MADLTLTPGFNYYYVAHNVWGQVSGQLKNSSTRQLHYVPEGTSVMSTAGKAGTWLGKAGKQLTKLTIIAHGSPGEFFLGEKVTSENIAPLGGWLYSFFDGDATGIEILGCNAAADSTQKVGKFVRGQANRLDDAWLSHKGHELLWALAKAAGQKVEGPLDALTIVGLRLRSYCRRVYPNGASVVFDAGGV